MARIKLTQGKYAIVDDEDYEWLSRHSWHFDGRYAAGSGIYRHVRLHQLLLNSPKGLTVDHINRDKLDNRKANLRIATYSENLQNTGRWKHNTSGHRGVTWHRLNKRWQAQIKKGGRNIYLGGFLDIKDAIEARKMAELLYFTI